MDNEKILDKIQKLLRLANSNNVHESALAAASAQKLMHKYNLTVLMVESYDGKKSKPEQIIDFTTVGEPLEYLGKNESSWKTRLAVVISKANHCRVYINRDQEGNCCIGLIGTIVDATAVRYLYSYLLKEIERLVQRDGKGQGKTWFNNFKLGAVYEIKVRLDEALEESKSSLINECVKNNIETIHTTTALAKFSEKDQAVQNFMEQMKLKKASPVNTIYNPSAFEAGQKAAREIDLNNDNPRLDPERKKLPDT